MTATTHNCRVTLYKGWVIKKPQNFYLHSTYIFFKDNSGEEDAATASSVEEAKDLIDDKIAEHMPAFYKVETYALIWNIRLPIITKFTWLSEAVKFASERNGLLIAEFKSI